MSRTSDVIIPVKVGGDASVEMISMGDDFVAECYRKGGPDSFEAKSLRIWANLAKAAKIIYDVGSFTGVYSLVAAASNPSARVVAFEPTKHVYSRALMNIRYNGFDNRISPINLAAGDSFSDAVIHHYDGVYCLGSGSTLEESGRRPFWYQETVKTIPLDIFPVLGSIDRKFAVIRLENADPDLLKIDVEGYELRVLEGMQNIIVRSRPIMIIECLSAEQVNAVHRLLLTHGYGAMLINDTDGSVLEDLGRYTEHTKNVIFVPNDKRTAEFLQHING